VSKTVFKNTFHYGALQLLSYGIPLLLIPYISRTIGLERYGITEFSLEISLFFGAMLLFGYDFTMSRKLSQNRDDRKVVNGLFWKVFYSRVLMSAIVLPAFILAGLYFLSELFTVEIIGYCTLFVASRIFSSWWFFQGLEKIKWIAWGNLLTKLILLLFVLGMVGEKEDYPLVVLGYGLSQFSVNLLAWGLLIHQESLKPVGLVLKEVFELIRSSAYVFLNEFSVIGFGALNLFLVKEYLTPRDLGIYVSAMKIVVISQNLVIQSLSKSLFPNLALALKENRELYWVKLREFRFYLGGFLLVLGLAVLLLRDEIVFLLFGPEYEEVSSYLVYTAFLPFFKGMTNIHGWQGLYVIGQERAMAGISLGVGGMTLLLLLWVIPKYGVEGVLAVRNLHELLLVALSTLFFYRLWRTEGN
jgi:PST family polysaccharide transporter